MTFTCNDIVATNTSIVEYLFDLGGLLDGNTNPPLSWYAGGTGGGALIDDPAPLCGGGLGGRSVGGRKSGPSSKSTIFGGSGGGGSLRGRVPSGTSFISNGTGNSPKH